MEKKNVLGFDVESVLDKGETVQQVMSGNVRSAGSTIGAGALGNMNQAGQEKADAFNAKEHL